MRLQPSGMAIPAGAAEPVDIELVLAADVSISVDGSELDLQRQGLAAAFRDPEVIDAIVAMPPVSRSR